MAEEKFKMVNEAYRKIKSEKKIHAISIKFENHFLCMLRLI